MLVINGCGFVFLKDSLGKVNMINSYDCDGVVNDISQFSGKFLVRILSLLFDQSAYSKPRLLLRLPPLTS
ncbi:TPA: hypothetical protein V1R76_000783 [Streptococcus pneumoniae]|nr:hypothetical protein [Streptococcus pneumoniae]HET0748450.1 hypothetical protein [Streptococcus pneumoniae]HET1437226.1 hypothetical protein [Streptococcus pneumoniae]HET2524659.1 hypothetical protein [Streptococcus pneumoniae]HET2597706.1 hypothetical protein [Streptococcus pneumoniae]